jgi:hypothetical protein
MIEELDPSSCPSSWLLVLVALVADFNDVFFLAYLIKERILSLSMRLSNFIMVL